jgi:glycosyltransferase involved in cell wall biosynthesis
VVEKTKILICITKSNWGGAQKYVFNLATSINKRFFDVVVACGGEGELKNKLLEKEVPVVTIKNLERNVSFSKDFSTLIELISIYKKENPQIVHLNSSKIGLLGSMAIQYLNLLRKIKNWFVVDKKQKIKCVFTAHGWVFNEQRPLWQKIIFKLLNKITIHFSDKIITVSNILKDQISEDDKIVTIYNGIENIKFKTKKLSREEISAKLKIKLDKNTKWLGTISELHKNKGIGYAIEAIKNLKSTPAGKDCKFFIIGEGEERKKLENMIREYKLNKDIFLLGNISNASELLKAFDLFLLTSTTEALPYVLLEAGLAGLPIIATRVGGIPEIIDDEIDGLLSRPKDSKEISAIIDFLLKDKTTTKDFSKRIKTKIKEKFSIKESMGETQKAYNDLLKIKW